MNNYKIFSFLIIAFGISISGLAKEINLTEFYEIIQKNPQEKIDFSGVTIIDDISELIEDEEIDLIEIVKIATNSDTSSKKSFIDCKNLVLDLSNTSGDYLLLESIHAQKIILDNAQFNDITLNKINADTVIIINSDIPGTITVSKSEIGIYEDYDNQIGNYLCLETLFTDYVFFVSSHVSYLCEFDLCTFNKGAYIGMEYVGSYEDFLLSRCVFEPIESDLSFQNDSILDGIQTFKTQLHLNIFGDIDQLFVEDCSFKSNEKKQLIFIEGVVDFLIFSNNTIEGVLFPSCTVNQQFYFADNTLNGNIVLEELFIGGINNLIEWESMNNNRIIGAIYPGVVISDFPEMFGYSEEQSDQIFKQTSEANYYYFHGQSDKEINDKMAMQKLISSYYRLYTVFKNNGQVKNANHVYVEMKDLELNQYQYYFKTEGGMDHFFQWQLNRLLRFYTHYGTNPSRAIVVSIFVILGFAIFYFFFPSEWDTKSKAMLISDFKLFVQKNKYGYIKPFYKLMLGLFLSMMNAIALSLNSFVTLGFGTIPTAGPAKYVCIAQGFLGWFLLSIFTASLINQVMF